MENAILAGAIKSISQGVLVAGPDKKIFFCNEAFLDITGFEEADILGKTCRVMQGPDTDQATVAAICDALGSGIPFAGEILNYRKSGEPFWNDLTISPQFDDDKTIRFFVGVTRDITTRKANEQKIAALERQYRLIFDNVGAGIVLHGADTKIIHANPRAHELLGLEETLEGIGVPDRRWIFEREDNSPLPPDEFPVNLAIAQGSPVRNQFFGSRNPRTKELRWFLCDAFPIFDEQNVLTSVLTSFTDSTELKELQIRAELDRKRFELATEATRDIVFDWDLENQDFWVNNNYSVMFGANSKVNLNGGTFKGQHVHASDREALFGAVSLALKGDATKFTREFRFVLPGGAVGHAIVFAQIFRATDGKAKRVVGSISGITDLRNADRELRLSEDRFRALANLASDAFWDWDLISDTIWFSEGWQSFCGEIPREKTLQEVWESCVHPEDKLEVYASLVDAIKAGNPEWSREYRIVDPSGKQRIVNTRASMTINEADQKTIRALGSIVDVTAQREIDEKSLQSQALKSTGQLTGGIAHDFNNILMVILGNVEMLEERNLSSSEMEMVGLIKTVALNGASLTKSLLSFARQQQLAPKPLQIADYFAKLERLIRLALPESVSLALIIPSGLETTKVDEGQLDNAILNLIINARDAMADGGSLTIEATNRELGESEILAYPDLKAGKYVEISVTDCGEGMEPETMARAFEPFFSTKAVGEGSGLGLSMAYGFAKQSGGLLTMTSEVGVGTTLTLLLPTTDSVAADLSRSKLSCETPKGKETILLVEDDDLVRRHVERQLEGLGYAVISCFNGPKAIEILQDNKNIDLLFTDIVMPGGMNGKELSDKALAIRPNLKVLYTSGYSGDAFYGTNFFREGENFLGKPYRRQELAGAIRSLLD